MHCQQQAATRSAHKQGAHSPSGDDLDFDADTPARERFQKNGCSFKRCGTKTTLGILVADLENRNPGVAKVIRMLRRNWSLLCLILD